MDPIVSQVYEPGSVMKMFTAAAALEEGVVTLNTPIADEKVLNIGPDKVRNGDLGSIGTVPFEDIIARSRNVGTGKVALSLGDTTYEGSTVLYDMWQRLGIGRVHRHRAGQRVARASSPTPTTSRGNRSTWSTAPSARASRSRRSSWRAASARWSTAGGCRHRTSSPPSATRRSRCPRRQQVIETSLSDELRKLMVHVVEAGPHYAPETLIPGYVVGGKTGTAQIWDQRAGDVDG